MLNIFKPYNCDTKMSTCLFIFSEEMHSSDRICVCIYPVLSAALQAPRQILPTVCKLQVFVSTRRSAD